MEELSARVVLVDARPLDAAEVLQTPVGHATVHGRQFPELVPDHLGGRIPPVVPEAARQRREDLEVIACLAWWVERPAHPLHSSLRRRDRTLALRPADCRRQHHVGHLGGLGHEDVLH